MPSTAAAQSKARERQQEKETQKHTRMIADVNEGWGGITLRDRAIQAEGTFNVS